MTFRVIHGDCIEQMQKLADEGVMVDSIVTDPPYHLKSIVSRFSKTSLEDDNITGQKGKSRSTAMNRLSRGFMGKSWDGGDIANRPETWELAYNILKPGGYLLAFGGTRTFHRMICAIEDAGFEVRDCLMWMYGTGFPKSHKVKVAGYEGWGTALKPAWEPIVFARKALEEKTIDKNVLMYGTGGINIDGCRVELAEDDPLNNGIYGRDEHKLDGNKKNWGFKSVDREAGLPRWPTNIIHDGSEEVEESFALYGNSISRYFYSAKASGKDRVFTCKECGESLFKSEFSNHKHGKNDFDHIETHPTCKPISLMRYLVRLVTPPNGTVLDPFSGSGTTLQAAIEEDFSCIGIEREDEYVKNIHYRLDNNKQGETISTLYNVE